jgi:hypothetical protein
VTIYWTRLIRRTAVAAMRGSGSPDILVPARPAPEGAMRDEIDLLELLLEPKPTPPKPMPAVTFPSQVTNVAFRGRSGNHLRSAGRPARSRECDSLTMKE